MSTLNMALLSRILNVAHITMSMHGTPTDPNHVVKRTLRRPLNLGTGGALGSLRKSLESRYVWSPLVWGLLQDSLN